MSAHTQGTSLMQRARAYAERKSLRLGERAESPRRRAGRSQNINAQPSSQGSAAASTQASPTTNLSAISPLAPSPGRNKARSASPSRAQVRRSPKTEPRRRPALEHSHAGTRSCEDQQRLFDRCVDARADEAVDAITSNYHAGVGDSTPFTTMAALALGLVFTGMGIALGLITLLNYLGKSRPSTGAFIPQWRWQVRA